MEGSLTIRDRTRGLVADKSAHVEHLRDSVARLQRELFGAFPEKEGPEPSVAREDTVEGDLRWLLELNQDTRNALEVFDGIIDKIAGSRVERTNAAAPTPPRVYRDAGETAAPAERRAGILR